MRGSCGGCHFKQYMVDASGALANVLTLHDIHYNVACFKCCRFWPDGFEAPRDANLYPYRFDTYKEAENASLLMWDSHEVYSPLED